MKAVRFLKAALAVALFFSLFAGVFSGTEKAGAASVKTAFVNTSTKAGLTVRSGAGTKYKALGSLKYGTSVKVYAKKSSGWSEIKYKGKKAYVSTKYLKFYTGVKVTKNNYKGIKDLVYPQVAGLKNKAAQDKINKILLKDAKADYADYQSIKKQAKKDKKEGSCQGLLCDYEFNTIYLTEYNDGTKLSILSYNYQYMGGAHGSTYAQTFNFDVKTGKQIKISDLLTSKSKYNKVQKYAFDLLKKKEIHKPFVKKQSDVPVNKNSQFYFTFDGIMLVFQEYAVASYADGHPLAAVPASVFK